jgi:hypothetical protein
MSKKISTYISLLLIGIMGFLWYIPTYNETWIIGWMEQVYAEDCSGPNPPIPCAPPAPQNTEVQKMLQSLVAWLNIVLDILTILVTPAIILASWLMSPDWTSGDLFQIRPMIHDLWVTVSNITYFIYAILLIFIALATIFNSENYGYKQLLPKLALGILMVPLSWWFIQFTISLATVVTAGVINIPTEVVINYNKGNADSWWNTKSIPMETKFENDKTIINGNADPTKKCADTSKCISPQDFIQKSGGVYSSLMIYSFSIFKFQDVKELSSNLNAIKSVGQIINQAVIGAIMFVVFWLLVIALIFMLMMRAIKLWFYAIFSPFMTLNFVLGDKLFGESGKSFDVKEFIGLAFVPALVGLCLSFGLVIVSVMLKPSSTVSPWCSATECSITLFGNPENTIKSVKAGDKTTTTATVWGASYIFTGDVTSGSATGDIVSALNLAGWIIGTIIINIIALIFIWVAFMAAKGVSAVAKAAFEPFEAMGNKLGSMAMTLPKYAPILPGGLSVSGAGKAIDTVQYAAQKRDTDNFEKSKIWQMLNANKNLSDSTSKELIKAIKEWNASRYNDIMNGHGGKEMAWNSGAPEAMMEALKAPGVNKDLYLQQKLWIQDSATREKIIRFSEDRDKSELKNDLYKKELFALMNQWRSIAAKPTTNVSSIDITVNPWDNKMKIGSDVIDAKVDDSLIKIVDAMKKSSVKSKFTEEDIRSMFGKIAAFKKWDNTPDQDKLNELVKWLWGTNSDFFKWKTPPQPTDPWK